MVAGGLQNSMPNLVLASDAVNKGIGRGAWNDRTPLFGL